MVAYERSVIEGIATLPFIDGNRVTLLYKGRDSFDAIFDAVKHAKDFISLQFYIFRNDETGTELAALLRKKAQEGIAVYILYDHFGSFGTPRSFWKEMRHAGIHIRASRPFKWSSPFHYVRRDHRKLMVVDGTMAFTGGLNIANEYGGFHLRLRKGWRDTGIMLHGPITTELYRIFEKTWLTWGGEPITPHHLPEPESLYHEQGLPAVPIFASSSRGRRRMRKLLYYSIYNARKSILLTTAYFTPSKRMLESLEEAVRKGIEVKLIVPGVSDVPAASYAGRAFFSRLLKAGIKIYAYRGDMLHAKSYVFDRCWSIVGSANLDFQSLRWNDEGNVGILDEGFGKKMAAIFEEDEKRSIELTETEWSRRSIGERIKEQFFALFRRRL